MDNLDRFLGRHHDRNCFRGIRRSGRKVKSKFNVLITRAIPRLANVRATFETPDGVKRTGSISALDASLFGTLYPNDPVAVLYDPEDPEVNTLWVD